MDPTGKVRFRISNLACWLSPKLHQKLMSSMQMHSTICHYWCTLIATLKLLIKEQVQKKWSWEHTLCLNCCHHFVVDILCVLVHCTQMCFNPAIYFLVSATLFDRKNLQECSWILSHKSVALLAANILHGLQFLNNTPIPRVIRFPLALIALFRFN